MSHLIIPDTPGYFIFKILQMLSVFALAYINLSIIFPHKEILKASNHFCHCSLRLHSDLLAPSDPWNLSGKNTRKSVEYAIFIDLWNQPEQLKKHITRCRSGTWELTCNFQCHGKTERVVTRNGTEVLKLAVAHPRKKWENLFCEIWSSL